MTDWAWAVTQKALSVVLVPLWLNLNASLDDPGWFKPVMEILVGDARQPIVQNTELTPSCLSLGRRNQLIDVPAPQSADFFGGVIVILDEAVFEPRFQLIHDASAIGQQIQTKRQP